MTEAVRVFISHSAADAPGGGAANASAHAVRIAVREALKAAGFHVLIDEVELKAGDTWRARINLWLGLCDAAVLILSPAVVERPHYVAYEANVLNYRRSVDPTFRIIPVLVGVNMDDIREPLNPAQVSEWQKAVGGTPEEAAASVVEGLAGLVPSGSRSQNVMAQVLEPMLPKGVAQLNSAAAVLRIDELPWENVSESRHLALRLLGSGMSEPCTKAIRYFPGDREGFQRSWLKAIGELIGAAWVDLKVGKISSNICDADPQPILLNAEGNTTARAYLKAAQYFDIPYINLRVVEAPLVLPELSDPESHEKLMIEKIRVELENQTRNGETLAKMLARAKKFNEGVVVIVHEESLTPGLLPKLRQSFDHVAFFVLGGAQAGRLAGNDVLVVTPKLADGDEKTFLARYDEFIDEICAAPEGGSV